MTIRRLFDAHCHVQDKRFNGKLDDVMKRAFEAGVEKMVCCGTSEEDWDRVENIARRYGAVIPQYGIHPWFVSSRSGKWLERLERKISESRAGVGEIGLDFMIQDADRKDQVGVFIEQLRLARRYSRPVSIHCRKAWGSLVDILKKEGGFPHGGIIHSYSGSGEMVSVLEKLGAHISFSGSITRRGNKKVREAARRVSKDRLLVETDSPDQLPLGAPEGFNEPAYLVHVLRELENIREEELGLLCFNT